MSLAREPLKGILDACLAFTLASCRARMLPRMPSSTTAQHAKCVRHVVLAQ
jgi:hypothetical protein